MDHCRNGIGSVYDTAWPCAILRWFGARTQRAERFYAGICHRLFDEHSLARCGLLNRIWIRHIGYWGGLDKMFLLGVDADALSGTLPEVLFFAFQMTFAVITPP